MLQCNLDTTSTDIHYNRQDFQIPKRYFQWYFTTQSQQINTKGFQGVSWVLLHLKIKCVSVLIIPSHLKHDKKVTSSRSELPFSETTTFAIENAPPSSHDNLVQNFSILKNKKGFENYFKFSSDLWKPHPSIFSRFKNRKGLKTNCHFLECRNWAVWQNHALVYKR